MDQRDFSSVVMARPAPRRSRQARVAWGGNVVTIGGDAPVRVQSMTNTDTVDVIGTAIQVKELAIARNVKETDILREINTIFGP